MKTVYFGAGKMCRNLIMAKMPQKALSDVMVIDTYSSGEEAGVPIVKPTYVLSTLEYQNQC